MGLGIQAINAAARLPENARSDAKHVRIASISRAVGKDQTTAHRAFTLIEALVVIAIIALLLAIVIPVLFNTRDRARTAKDLANLRSLAVPWSTYASDNAGVTPFFVPVSPGHAEVPGPGGTRIEIRYFDQTYAWPSPLAATGHAPPFPSAVYSSPWERSAPSGYPAYRSPCVFRVDPKHYNVETFRPLPYYLRPVRLDEVAFASEKALLASAKPRSPFVHGEYGGDWASRWGSGSASAVMTDGHAAEFLAKRFTFDFAFDGRQGMFGSHEYLFAGPMLHTTDGVRGRDIAR